MITITVLSIIKLFLINILINMSAQSLILLSLVLDYNLYLIFYLKTKNNNKLMQMGIQNVFTKVFFKAKKCLFVNG